MRKKETLPKKGEEAAKGGATQQGGSMPLPSKAPAKAGKGKGNAGGATEERVKRLTRAAVASVAAAALGVTFGVYSLTSANAQIAQTKENLVNVVVAANEIPSGSTITAESLKTIEVPSAYVSSGAVSNAEDFVGQTAITRIDANTQITNSSVAGGRNTGSLANSLAAGYKAVTISVDSVQGFSGMLRAGDTVDVLTTSSSMGGSGLERITGSALVIALDGNLFTQSTGGTTAMGSTSSSSNTSSSYSTITLEVTPNEADAIRAAQAAGGISLELHSTAKSGSAE